MAAADGLMDDQGIVLSLQVVEADSSPKFGLRPQVLRLIMVRGKPQERARSLFANDAYGDLKDETEK